VLFLIDPKTKKPLDPYTKKPIGKNSSLNLRPEKNPTTNKKKEEEGSQIHHPRLGHDRSRFRREN
jgi:hypothetical protein